GRWRRPTRGLRAARACAARATARALDARWQQRRRTGSAGGSRSGKAVSGAPSGGKLWHPGAANARGKSRKSEVERCAPIRLALRPDAAAVTLDDAPRDRQANARTFEILRGVKALEDAEQALGTAGIEARTVVANRVQLVPGARLATDLDERVLAPARELQRVGDEVHPDLAQQ